MSYLDALQTTLAGEHAAVYVLSYLGAQTSSTQQPTLSAALGDAYAVHLDRRDQLTSLVLAAGAEPVAASAVYALPDLDSSAQVEKHALDVERSCASTYEFLVANAASAQRRFAIGLLVDAAVRALAFGETPQTYPGR